MAKIRGWNPEIKRQKILDSAIKILNQKEYYKCPIDEIAKKAGIAKGTVYLYFKSKEELYFSIFYQMVDKVNEIAEDVRKNNLSATKQLYLILERISNFIDVHRNIFLAIRQQMEPYEKKIHQEKFLKELGELMKTISTVIEMGIKNKEFKKYPPLFLSIIFLNLCHIIFHQKIDIGKHKSISVNLSPKFIFNIFLKGIEK